MWAQMMGKMFNLLKRNRKRWSRSVVTGKYEMRIKTTGQIIFSAHPFDPIHSPQKIGRGNLTVNLPDGTGYIA